MFRQPLSQILNIWSSQAPQALNIIQVVAKSTFPQTSWQTLLSPLAASPADLDTPRPAPTPKAREDSAPPLGAGVQWGRSPARNRGEASETRESRKDPGWQAVGAALPWWWQAGTQARAVQLVREQRLPIARPQTAWSGLVSGLCRYHLLGSWGPPLSLGRNHSEPGAPSALQPQGPATLSLGRDSC